MTLLRPDVSGADVFSEIRSLARPLTSAEDLDPLIERVSADRYVCIGEASHGTHEYYRWRALLSRRLIEEHGFTWIGVEGDWPDCWRINRWVRGQGDQDLDVYGLLDRFERWPTWMWANQEVAEFLAWLREWNAVRPEHERVGFYGLDVYSLWDSLREIISWLESNAPDAVPAAMRAWECFVPHHEDPHAYARSTRLVPESCEADVVALLVEVRSRTHHLLNDDEDAFDAEQNAEVAADAEHYYRIMVRGDRESWNIRDYHMADTIERVARHLGPQSKGLVWEHNTHVGDARATDMARDGLVNVGQLIRERHTAQGVALVGFASPRTAARCSPQPPGVHPNPYYPCPKPAPTATKTSSTAHSASPPSSSSATTDPAPGSLPGSTTGRSASSTNHNANTATTSRPASAAATTHSSGSNRPQPYNPSTTKTAPKNPNSKPNPPATRAMGPAVSVTG